MLLASAEDGTVQIWAVPSGQAIRRFAANEAVWASFLPGRPAVVGITYGVCIIWDLNTGQSLNMFRLEEGKNAVMTPDGRLLIMGNSVYVSSHVLASSKLKEWIGLELMIA